MALSLKPSGPSGSRTSSADGAVLYGLWDAGVVAKEGVPSVPPARPAPAPQTPPEAVQRRPISHSLFQTGKLAPPPLQRLNSD